jgi:hypothetical protein
MVQQMRAQLQDTKTKTETSSLWTALSKWWKGEKEDVTNEPRISENGGETTADLASTPVSQTAATYVPSPSPVNTYTHVPQPAATQPAVAVEEFFVQRTEPLSTATPPLTAWPSIVPEIHQSALPSLSALAPLTELLPIQPEQMLPAMPVQYHVGSDLLLRNSGQSVKSDASAKVFRSQ